MYIEQEKIETFLHGEDDEKYIVGVEYDYKTNKIFKIKQHPVFGKVIESDKFTPFLWLSDISDTNFYNGSTYLKEEAKGKYGVFIKRLQTHNDDRLKTGHIFLIQTTKTYNDLIMFFKNGGLDPWGEKFKHKFIILNPVEQYLIQKQKRLFKGIDEYSDVHRLVFDIETTGLNPKTDKIILIGLKDNRGYKEVISATGNDGEKRCIENFLTAIGNIKPTIVAGYNSASFDFPFILERANILGVDVKGLTNYLNMNPIREREGSLKLANEVEKYTQHILFGFNVIDISHSVRRAQAINSEIKSWGLKYITKFLEKEKPNRVYIPGKDISKIYESADIFYMNEKTGNYKSITDPIIQQLSPNQKNKLKVWSGKRIVEQYLDDDLYETLLVDDSFSQSTFLLSKLVPTTYERVSTMGTATLWKLIMLAWSYHNDLAIPKKDEKRPIVGGLSRLLRVGYSREIYKFDFASLYPSFELVNDVFPKCDVMGVLKSLLKYFRTIRIKYKRQAEEYQKTDTILAEAYDRKQLPIKIFINAFFGSLSAPHVFPWGDMNMGELTTCGGRQTLRMMLMFFMRKKYIPTVLDTDGCNFIVPDNISETRYIGKGLNELVTKDKVYEGVSADLAEFNDIFMRNEMGLDMDYYAPVTINISRKNYIIKIIKKGKEKVKLTGNTIKSKKLQQFIIDFLDEGLKYLLAGDGVSFIELYYEYVEKICKKEIPLAKIANKSRVKMTPEDYIEYTKKTNKAGVGMARQAHMELILQNDYKASLGETIYYINNGTKKAQGDVQKITKPTKKEKEEFLKKFGIEFPKEHIQINCYMISEKDIMETPNMTGDYNVQRYLQNFNKRIEPLLVVFKPEIRDEIIIDDIQKRPFFTKSQCELSSGFPLKDGHQDSIDEVLTLSENEVVFWNKINKDPFFMYPEGALQYVDEHYVNLNRRLVEEKRSHIKTDNEDLHEDDSEVIYHVNIDV